MGEGAGHSGKVGEVMWAGIQVSPRPLGQPSLVPLTGNLAEDPQEAQIGDLLVGNSSFSASLGPLRGTQALPDAF